MTAKSILPAILIGLLFATAAGGQGLTNMKLTGSGAIAMGDGTTKQEQPDGSFQVGNGRETKTCKAGQLAVASSIRITIVTVRDSKTYPDGVVACLDMADFGGAVDLAYDNGNVLRPSVPAKP